MSFLTDFFLFLRDRKKFWLLPILILMVLFGVLLVLGEGAAAPFVYSLF